MWHITSKTYKGLQKRLDDAAQGAPDSETLYKIIELLFTEEEAKLTSVLPLKFFTATEASKLWKKSEEESQKMLDTLSDKWILLDFSNEKERIFFVAPTMVWFFEFALMRTDWKLNCKALSELFYHYINQEENFMKRIFMQKTPVDRVFLNEESMPQDKSIILDYEKATHVIDTASVISQGRCYCRHKKEHLWTACDNPQDVCLSFNKPAASLIKHKIAKEISKEKAHEILNRCIKLWLVQIGDNVQNEVNWICNCCSCCCEWINCYKKLWYSAILTSNFISKNDIDKCKWCWLCAKKCPVEAIKIVEKNWKKFAKIDEKLCIWCWVCNRFCPIKSVSMHRVEKPEIVPKDSFERLISVAIDTWTIQNYLFDNYTLLSHKIMRSFLWVLMSLPLSKQILASKQLKSRFLNRLVKTKLYEKFDALYNEGKGMDYRHDEFSNNN